MKLICYLGAHEVLCQGNSILENPGPITQSQVFKNILFKLLLLPHDMKNKHLVIKVFIKDTAWIDDNFPQAQIA